MNEKIVVDVIKYFHTSPTLYLPLSPIIRKVKMPSSIKFVIISYRKRGGEQKNRVMLEGRAIMIKAHYIHM
jgi:hypothetical protein